MYSTKSSSEKVMPKQAAVVFDKLSNDYSAMMFITIFICFMLVRLLCWLPKRKKAKGGFDGSWVFTDQDKANTFAETFP